METLLEIVSMFISKVIDSIKDYKAVNTELTVKYIDFIEVSTHCIVKELQRISLSPDFQEMLPKYIRINQSIYTSACDKIGELEKQQQAFDIKPSNELSTLIRQLNTKLEDHLIYLSGLYPHHYGNDMHVSINLVQRLMEPINENFNLFKLRHLKGETAHLIKIINAEITLVTDGEIFVTYKKVYYLRNLVNDLLKVQIGEKMYDSVCDLLATRNFNNASFLLFHKGTIQDKIGDLEDDQQRYEYMLAVRKHYRSLAFSEVEGYDPENISVIQYVISFVSQEILYLNDTRKAELPGEEGSNENVSEGSKIVITMNVAMQAAFLRILVNAGIYKGIVVKDLLRFCSKHFRTVRQEALDVESLRTKYYAIDGNTKNSLIAFCRRLLEEARDID